MSQYPPASTVLGQVNILLKELDESKTVVYGWPGTRTYYKRYRIREVCDRLSIFDWWNEYLSYSQLKSMRDFLVTAIKYGYTGYVCFKVGATGCAHGMWANKEESTDGYSPDGEYLYHSFRCEDNYWVIGFGDGTQSRDLNKRDLKKILSNVEAYRIAEKKRLQELNGQIIEGLHDILNDIHNILKESKEESADGSQNQSREEVTI